MHLGRKERKKGSAYGIRFPLTREKLECGRKQMVRALWTSPVAGLGGTRKPPRRPVSLCLREGAYVTGYRVVILEIIVYSLASL